MQKLELRNNLNEIIKRLNSLEIIKTLQNNAIDKIHLLRLLIDSKAGYDQAIINKEKEKVFEQFEAKKIYDTNNFSDLIAFVSNANVVPVGSATVPRQNLLSNNVLNDFFSFQKTIVSTFKLIDNLMLHDKEIFDSNNNFDISQAQNNGNLILEIVDEGYITLNNLTSILTSLQKLIETIYLLFSKIEKEDFDLFPTVKMIDSGSDINIILKLPEKAANLTAQIIKEFWDFIMNNKNYKLNQKAKALDSTITVLEKLKRAKDANIIDDVTAEVLKKGIIENAENIVLKNTLTKQIIMESRAYSNRDLLLEQNNRYLLNDSDNKSIDEEDSEVPKLPDSASSSQNV